MSTAPKRQPIPFGKYLLLDRVNIGGMAEVWRAKMFGAGGFERLLAIKRILPNIAEDAEFIAMFIDEAKITVQLNHANIAQIYELSHIANSYYIAMEYVSGKDLRAVFDRCRKRGEPAPVPLTCYAVAQCCEGLDYAHRAKDKSAVDMNIVHRDVSPQNVLVSFDGEVKVIDFGIAKAAGKATKTQAGILKGKFGYMSPEQIRGLPLDRRSDLFAIGICLYELLTGERLFVGDTDFSVLEKVRKVEVLPPSHFNRRVPAELERIVMKALAKDVEDRYQYASELAEELRTFMYATGNTFARKDLAAFMRATFAEDFEKERSRLQEYVELKPPEGMLAAAEAGYGGSFPTSPLPLVSGSAVTALPTAGPAPRVVMTPGASGLPPIARSVPPTIGPPSLQPLRPVDSGPLASAPKLTAAAPVLANEPEEYQATIIDGMGGQGSGPQAGGEEIITDSKSPTGPLPEGTQDRVAAAWLEGDAPDEPPRSPRGAPKRPSGPRKASRLVSPTPGRALGDSQPMPTPLTNRSPSAAQLAPPSNTRLIIALAGIVALLVVGVVAAVLLRPPTTGLLIINVPEEVRGRVQLQINGELVTEKNGGPLKEWPQVRPVKVGKTTVRLSASGYEPLFEVVEVKEAEPAELKKDLKRSAP